MGKIRYKPKTKRELKKLDKLEEKFDLDPSATKGNKLNRKRRQSDADDDTPKSFKRVQQLMQLSKEQPNKKKEDKDKKTDKKDELKIQKGESLRDFSFRVNKMIPVKLKSRGDTGVDSSKKEKQRERLKQLKLKKKKNKNKQSSDDEDVFLNQDKVKFGEVIKEPPKFKAPKKIAEKASIVKLVRSNNSEFSSDIKTPVEQPKSMYREIMLAEERERIQKLYRLHKKSINR